MAVASSNFAELLWPGIKHIWGQKYKDFEPLYPRIFTKKKATLAFEKEQGVTGLGLASVKDQGKALPYEDPFQGYQKEYVMVTYAIGSSITREMSEDDQYNYINSIPAMLAKSMGQTEETITFNHLNRGFNTLYTGADGLSLFNASHTNVGGGTYRNQLATTSDLTQTTLETMLQDLLLATDDQGLVIRLMPKALVVHPASNFRARKLLESDYVTGSADNDKNGIPGLFADLVVSPYLTDTDAWFVVAGGDDGLVFYTKRDAEIVRDNEFDTQNLKFATTKRFASGWTNPRLVWGTAGA